MKTAIREMQVDDISAVVRYDLMMIGETLGEEIIKDHLENSTLMKYMILEDVETKDIIGTISIWIDEDKAQINNFYILTPYQKQGLGKKFIEQILGYLRNIAIKEITLEVRASNQTAIRLYESLGFKNVTIRKNYYANGETAYLMYLRIGSD